MSIFALVARPERAVIAADSAFAAFEAGKAPRTAGRVSKIFAMPHLRTAMVGRGCYGVLLAAFEHLLVNYEAQDVADLVEPLGIRLREVIAAAEPGMDAAGLSAEQRHIEAVLCGWSEVHQSVIAAVWDTRSGRWGELANYASIAAPCPLGHDGASLLREFGDPTRETALRLMHLSDAQLTDDLRESWGVGGPISVCELDRWGMRFTTAPALASAQRDAA